MQLIAFEFILAMNLAAMSSTSSFYLKVDDRQLLGTQMAILKWCYQTKYAPSLPMIFSYFSKNTVIRSL